MSGLVVENTKKILFQKIPKLREQYWEKSSTPPQWMDRLQAAAGPHKSGNDPHIAGRALDIVLFSSEPGELEVANNIVKVFLEAREKMKWIAVIYNREQWHRNGLKTPRLKKGDPSFEHLTHIHIEWDAASMSHTGFELDLEKGLNRVITGVTFYIYFGGGMDPQKIREQRTAYIEKIKAKGGKVTDVLSIWTDYVVQIGDEVKLPGDPLETDLEMARMLGVKIISTSDLDSKL